MLGGHVLKRHPVPVKAHFDFSLVLTYAFPAELLAPLLPPGLVLDTYGPNAFLAIAMVQTRRLRPAPLPALFGQDFFLTGYRVFVRVAEKPSLRGLRILRSDADNSLMVWSGNLLTHYGYEKCRATTARRDGILQVEVETLKGVADLALIADLASRPAPLPSGSPFASLADSRRFAGPLPYTFEYEPETRSLVSIRATRDDWTPEPIAVRVDRATFLERPPFSQARPTLANAFFVEDIDYRWERGELIPLDTRS